MHPVAALHRSNFSRHLPLSLTALGDFRVGSCVPTCCRQVFKEKSEHARMFHQFSKAKKKIFKDEGSLEQKINLFSDNIPKVSEGRSWMGFEAEDYGKLGGMESTSTLFEKIVPVRMTKANAEDRHMDLTARFIMGLSKVHRSTKVLQVQITNELDPFFFYSLEVNEDDFQSLKVEQCILVDFATFPYKFIELLEQCIVSSCTDNPRGTGRFLAVLHLRTGDSTFTVVETNQFKHLSHLSLVFRQGNDTVIKQFLAGRLAEFKAINGDMHEKLRRTLHSLEKALRDVNNLSSELSELKENQSRNICELKAEFTLEFAHEKEKVMQETTELKERIQKERVELESRLRQQIDQQQQRASDLDNQVRSLLDAKYMTDNKIIELKNKCASLEKDLEETTQEGDRLRKENRHLETDKNEAEKETNRHLIRLSALEQEVADKNESLSKMTQQVEAQASQRSALESSRKEAQASADRAEERASASADELSKCYQIIEKLQVELRASKQKVKLKGQVTSQQDNLLNERQAALDKAQAENATVRNELTILKANMEDKKKKVEELTTKLDEAQNLQQSNQQMIQWLNQQLTEVQLGKLVPGVSTTSSRFTPFNRTTTNTSSLAYSCLTSTTNNNRQQHNTNDPATTTTPLSSTSSGYKHQFPMSSPYLSSSATGIPITTFRQANSGCNPQPSGFQSGLGVFHATPGLGLGGSSSQREAGIGEVTKIAVQAAQRVQYMPKGMMMPLDEASLMTTWEDPGCWGAKHSMLPRPQLSFADRSGYANHTESPVTLGRPTNNSNLTTTAPDGCQSNCSRPQSPNQQAPSGRQSPSLTMTPIELLSREREAATPLVGSSGRGSELAAGLSTTSGNNNEAASSSPKGNSRAQAATSPACGQQSTPREKEPSPARARALKPPPNRSPLKTHFSRR